MANPTAVWSHVATWLMTCFLICQPVRADSEIFKSQVIKHHPGRKVLSASVLKQGPLLHKDAVSMHHSVFLMDPAFTPQLHKNKTHVLLQLNQHLTRPMEEDLHRLGLELQEYIPNNTWKGVIFSDRVAEIQSLPWVKAIGGIFIEDKLPKSLMGKILTDTEANESDNTLELLLTFYEDIAFDRAREIADVFTDRMKQETYISGNRMLIQIPASYLADIAAYDEVSWIEEGARVKRPANCNAARLSNVDHVKSDYGLDGYGVVLGQWDGGAVDNSHPDLSEQVTVRTGKGISSHATGVAGTLVGRGNCDSTGMAPEAALHSFDFDGDVPGQMKSAKYYYDTIIANHSWAYETGWEYNSFGDGMWVWWTDGAFGSYTQTSSAWDNVIRFQGVISINAVGNDRDDMGVMSGEAHYHKSGTNRVYFDAHPPDGDYGCISDVAAAKNVIAVGAVDDNDHMTEFSSWGPTNDGRIKPDLVANGDGLTTTYPGGKYASMTGTSFATPVVSGSVALLVQAYRQIMGEDPSPAMVKALLVNTAVDLGETGPDYQYGWGRMDLRSAINTLNSPDILFAENMVSTHLDTAYTIQVLPETPEFRATVAWTDRSGSPSAGKALVNDIDLEISDPEGVVYKPWVLYPENPSYPAGTGVNSVDNIEQVFVSSPQPGEWIVRVKGTQIQKNQDYTLVSNLPMQNVAKVGTVFHVDEGTAEIQACPAVSSGNDILFLVVWSAWNVEEDGWNIYGKFFDDTLKKWKEQFKINTFTIQDQTKPAVATLPEPDGSFVVTWDSLDQDGNGHGVFGQRLNKVGLRIGDEFQVNTYAQDDQKFSAIAALESGGFVIVWASKGQDGSGLGVFAQMFHGDGTRVGEEFKVNTFTEHDQSSPSVAMLSDGGFVITWHSQDQDGDDWGVFGQSFDSQGQKIGTEFQLNITTRHAQQFPAIQSISNDTLLATWTSECQNGLNMGRDIYAQRFSYDGSRLGEEFQVNLATEMNHQDPSISVLSNGGFMVTWNTHFSPENRWVISGQLFDDMGNKRGNVFQIATYTGGEQSFHSLDMLSCGKYVITWCSGSQQTEYKGIYGQQLTVIDKPIVDISADDPGDSDDSKGCMVNLLTK